MTRGRKSAVVVAAVAGIASTPLVWLLDGPDTGQLVGAAVQGATGIAALVWALLQPPAPAAPVPVPAGPADSAEGTGPATATGPGSTANTGIRRPGGAGTGPATAKNTGEARADGGGRANTGIDYGS